LPPGRGFALLDPHGTSAERIADAIPKHRIKDVIYFDPTDKHTISFNPLQTESPALTAEQIITTIRNIFPDS